MEAMRPEMRRTTDVVTSQIDPFMRGRRGSSLLRQVQQPAMQALAGHELGQEMAGTEMAAELPFRMAPYTGTFGGRPTLGGRGVGLAERGQEFAEEMGRGGMGLAERGFRYETDPRRFAERKELARIGAPKEEKGGVSFIIDISF
jgi:hypothetical protein